MTAIVAQTLPGTAMANASQRRAAADEGDDGTAFGDLLDARKPAPTAKRAAHQPGPRAKEPAAAQDEPSLAGETGDEAPLRDRFPLLTALQRLQGRSDNGEAAPQKDAPEKAEEEKPHARSQELRPHLGEPPARTEPPAPVAAVDAGEVVVAQVAVEAILPAKPGRDDRPALDAAPPEKPAAQSAALATVTAAAVEAGPPRRDRSDARTQRNDAGDTGVRATASRDAATTHQAKTAAAPLPSAPLQSAPLPNAAPDLGPAMPSVSADQPQVSVRQGATALESPAPALAADEDAPAGARPAPATRAAALQQASVVAEQSFPAPAAYALSRTASDLVGAMTADAGWRSAAAAAQALPATVTTAAPAHSLRIELHPAELGAVTASLRLAGEQLSVEIRPETREAYRKLSADSEAIVRSLRGLGFDIDKVTVLQPALAVTPAARADGATQPTVGAGREQSSFQSGGNGGGAGTDARQWGGNRDDRQQESGRAAPQLRERSGGGLFI